MTEEEWNSATPSNGDFKRSRRKRQELTDPVKTDKVPPHSIEAEQGALACALLDPFEVMSKLIDKLGTDGEMFYDLRHRAIYEALLEMAAASSPIDLITLQQKLRDKNQLESIGGLAYLASLPDSVPSAANVDYYVEILREKRTLRRLVATCTEVVSRAYQHQGEVEALLDTVERDVGSICRRDQGSHRITPLRAVSDFSDDLERRWLHEGPSGILTGIHDFDNMNDGLQYGELFILGARPSQGKTALGLHLLYRACIMDEFPAVFISLEMSSSPLVRRLAARHCRIPMGDLVRGNITTEQFTALGEFNSLISSKPLTIHDFSSTGASEQLICSIIRRAAADGAKLVIIDYLQIITASKRSDQKRIEIGEISKALKKAAKETKVCLVVLAQLNREADKPDSKKEGPRQPRVSDIAESAQIERDADVIGLIYRDATPGGLTHLLIRKNRDGMSGYDIPLRYDMVYQEFTNATPSHWVGVPPA